MSRADDAPLAATASQVERWLLIEYRGLWAHDAVDGSTLSADVKRELVAWRKAEPRSRVLLVRRTERRNRDGLLAYRVSSREGDSWTRCLELERHEDLVGLDIDAAGAPVDHPLLLVCTHGKHDPCCARFGRPLYEAIREQVEDDWAWQCSHVGGDRFAGNLVVLPAGLYLGRVEPGDAWATMRRAPRRAHPAGCLPGPLVPPVPGAGGGARDPGGDAPGGPRRPPPRLVRAGRHGLARPLLDRERGRGVERGRRAPRRAAHVL